MKNLIYRALALMCLLATTLSFTACQTDDASADPSAVQLYAFGPTPVLRGSDISFLGENLNKVTEIILPENVSVTEITVESPQKITITVPQEATVGYVTLNYAGGSITTKTMMGYTEPYEITSISPIDKSVRAGDEITINGDYLNNITAVVFGGGASVATADFTSQSRDKITLNLPAEAISGKLYVEDYNGNQLYSDEELKVLQPTISSIAPLTIKAGAELTITGENLDLVASIEFGGAQVVEEFVSQSESEIVVVTPVTMADGVITLTSKAGQKVVSADELETVVPTSLAVDSDNFKAGNTLTISGDDLDLVTALQFAGSAAASEFTVDGSISVVIPADATDGAITLTTASTKSVETPSITLVKPAVTNVVSEDIISGEDIVATGTDLDLVTAVTLNGTDMEFAFDAEAGTITVTTLRESLSGDLVFATANGTKVIAAAMTLTPDSIVTISKMPETAMPGEEITIEGAKFNMIESMYLGETKVTAYSARSDSSMTFTVPEMDAAECNIVFNLTTGEKETSIGTIAIGQLITRVDVWSGSIEIGGWGNTQEFAKGALFADMPYGATLVFEYTATDGGDTQLKLSDPGSGWPVLAGPIVNEWGVITDVTNDSSSYSFAFADAQIDGFKLAGLIIAGQNIIITALYYTY